MNFRDEINQNNDVEKKCQELSETIEDFKRSIVNNMRLAQATRNLHDESDSLEQWVRKEFVRVPQAAFPGETLEHWTAKQRLKPLKTERPRSLYEVFENWVENEIRKDAIKMIEDSYQEPLSISGRELREMGLRLVSLADKLEN